MTDSPTAPELVAPEYSAAATRWKQAKIASSTGWLPPGLRGKTAETYMVLLAGEALGMNPAQTLRSVHFIAGRVTFSAELQRALILAGGHRLDVTEYSDDSVTLQGTRQNGSSMSVTWDMARAKRAGLLDRGNDSWKTYPRAMLLARATSELGRALFPDCLVGVASYNEWETADIVGESHDALNASAAEQQRDADLANADAIDAELVEDEADAAWVDAATSSPTEDKPQKEG